MPVYIRVGAVGAAQAGPTLQFLVPRDSITKSQRAALKEMKGWDDQVILVAP